MSKFFVITFLVGWTALATQGIAWSQQESDRIEKLESQVEQLRRMVDDHGGEGIALFLCGAFCALWAQQTGRSAWLWFFLGLFFNVITLMVLLYKNSRYRSNY